MAKKTLRTISESPLHPQPVMSEVLAERDQSLTLPYEPETVVIKKSSKKKPSKQKAPAQKDAAKKPKSKKKTKTVKK